MILFLKNFFLILSFLFLSFFSNAQNIAINTSGSVANASAMLDITSSTKGLLIPRMTLAEKTALNPLPAAAQGLIVYQTDGLEGFYYNTSTTTTPAWMYVLTASGANGGWTLAGNSITGTEFIGTTNLQDFIIKTNNTERLRILSTGQVGFGITPAAINFIDVLVPTGRTIGMNFLMPDNGASASTTMVARNNDNTVTATGSKTGVLGTVGGTNDAAGTNKKGIAGTASGAGLGTNYGGFFQGNGSNAAIINYGVYGGTLGNAAATNYALYGQALSASTSNANYALGLEDGHIKSKQTTLITGASAVTTYALVAQSATNATDVAGNISIVTTDAPGSVTYNFIKPYAVAPIVVLTPTSATAATAAALQFYVTTTVNGFTVTFTNANPLANTKTYSYLVIETQ